MRNKIPSHWRVLMTFYFLLVSCKETGIQSGNVEPTFSGVEAATAVSPYSVKLSWTQSPRFSQFKVYRKGFNTPLKSEQFAETTLTGLLPNTTYQFAVAGVRDSGAEEGISNFISVTTLPEFSGIAASGVTVQSSSRINLTWSQQSGSVSYKVFWRIKSENWNFASPNLVVNGANSAIATGLLGGTEYCFLVVAAYLDGSQLPSTGNLTQVNAKSPCAITPSDLNNLPMVLANEGLPGNYPWFLAQGGDPTYSIEVFDAAQDRRIASRTGNGSFKSFEYLDVKNYTFYALVKSLTGEQARIDLQVKGQTDKLARVRSPNVNRSNAKLTPPLFFGGKGFQSLGSELTSGDFNCDGLVDLAVSAPEATPTTNSNHYHQMGSVVVYYTYDPPPAIINGQLVDLPAGLKTDVKPAFDAVYPNPQLIFYPVAASNVRFGQALAVGNVNGDCVFRDEGSTYSGSCDAIYSNVVNSGNLANLAKIKSCDDIAISNDVSQVFVVFGDPTSGLVSGSGASNFGINELTCDPGSSSCRTVRISEANVTKFGKSIGFGDFNNDGYDDLMVGGYRSTDSTGVVYVYRGSTQGLFPTTSISKSFPVIVAKDFTAGQVVDGVTFDSNESASFGDAVGAAFNSRQCFKGMANYNYRPTAPDEGPGYDLGKCDDVVIGVPSRFASKGSIVTCKGNVPTLAAAETDKQKIVSWSCAETMPDEIYSNARGAARYGSSILGVENQNGYPLENLVGVPAPNPNVGGAIFVGAPHATVSGFQKAGKVYGYYMTPQANNFTVGGIQGILSTGNKRHSVVADNSIPCNAQNNNVINGTLRHCENQGLYNSPAQSDSNFGARISKVMDIESTDRGLPAIAVSAPYRDVLTSDGSATISDAGAVYLYRPDTSSFGVDSGAQVTQTQSSNDTTSTCTADCTWYSGGLNPFGPSIIYAPNLNKSAFFGLGGVASGDFDANGTGDIVASAPGDSSLVVGNGSFFLFSSNGAFPATVNNFDFKGEENISKELNYRFERAIVVGDVNGDGYDDVLTQVYNQATFQLVLFYGSPAGIINTVAPSANPTDLNPRLISYNLDGGFGINFYRIGSVNGDAYDDILVLGANGAYVFYGSFSGLVTNALPQFSPIGKNPLIFGRPGWGGGDAYISITQNTTHGNATVGSYTDASNQSVGFGDFNFDGYSDVAIGITHGITLPSDQDAALTTAGISGLYSGTNRGSIIVIYGGVNGLQVNRFTGRIKSSSGFATTTADVLAVSPCTAGTEPICKVQVLASPEGNGIAFGHSTIGLKSIEFEQGEMYDEVVVSDPSYQSNNGRVYLYKGSPLGLNPKALQTLVPDTVGQRFGYHLRNIGDINSDDFPDISVSAPEGALGLVYVFYGSNVASTPSATGAFFGATDTTSTNYWQHAPVSRINAAHSDPEKPWPQLIQPVGVVSGDAFGFGISSAGDFNLDGFNDLIVNVPNGDYNLDITQSNTGFFLLFFGSTNGLQLAAADSPSPRCYGGSSAVCDPFRIYLPDREEYEQTYLSPSALGDFDGDGVFDLLLSSAGRSHPSGLAFSVGVVYVVY